MVISLFNGGTPPMQLSKFGYYGDFFIYPVLIAAFTLCAIFETTGLQFGEWLLFSLSGVAAWTVAEYVLHRMVFHNFPFIKQMHDAHHTTPKALVGSPTWLSVAIGSIVVFAPLWWASGFMIASAITTGLMIGYLCYVTVHHLNHHGNPRHSTYLYWAKRRHALHHYCGETKNFGIITDFWDRFLGTEYPH
jgi:sterol desaturase/sphingolipid hydroxylase (fatty acid hydroxylase superfamily)